MIKTLLKPVNLIKAGYSYIKSSAGGKADIKGMPVSVSIELTNNCNLSCPALLIRVRYYDKEEGIHEY